MSFDQHNQPDQRPRRRWWLFAVPAVVVAAGAVWLAVALLTPDQFTVDGTLKLRTNCAADGVQVEIIDRESQPLAVGKLVENPANPCELSFTVADVPDGEPLYGVRVGSEERGTVWKSEAELRDGISLKIG
jgi:hypothetical protein